jgi:phosphinothricin acetyltransferase
MIRPAQLCDASAIVDIYNHYVQNTTVTFEMTPVTATDMEKRIAECASSQLPWLVAEEAGQVIGYCYASQWKGRRAYRFSVEATVYVAKEAMGKGWGTQLYQALFATLAARGIHAVLCGIALPNAASVALHEKFGMEKVAHLKEVGHKFDQWIFIQVRNALSS